MVDNAIVFPDNIISIGMEIFDSITRQICYVYGKNVQRIGKSAFYNNIYIQFVKFPNLFELLDYAFVSCY